MKRETKLPGILLPVDDFGVKFYFYLVLFFLVTVDLVRLRNIEKESSEEIVSVRLGRLTQVFPIYKKLNKKVKLKKSKSN
jgi:hypothetical protein